MLRGSVWIDETYVNDADLSKGCGQARKRGLSKQKTCIAVGIDARKEPVAVVCGHGKPSSARIKKAMKAHVAKGATLVHDRERAHGVLHERLLIRFVGSLPFSLTAASPLHLDPRASACLPRAPRGRDGSRPRLRFRRGDDFPDGFTWQGEHAAWRNARRLPTSPNS